MSDVTIDDVSRQFLNRLFEHTHGDSAAQVSMYDIGEAIGLDRGDASKVAQNLMGWSLVEVRTLSGDIGITAEGLSEVEAVDPDGGATPENAFVLGSDKTLDDEARRSISDLASRLKGGFDRLGLNFDQSEAFVADIKTIEAQLTSSQPKTAILRECFRSLQELLQAVGTTDELTRINTLLRE